jgi:tetraacyldisaccharide-1-P 4'-kinase
LLHMAKKKKEKPGKEAPPEPVAEALAPEKKEKKPKKGDITYLESLDAAAERRARLEAAKAAAETAQARAAKEAEPASARRLLFPLIPLYRIGLAFRELSFAFGLEPKQTLRYPVVSIGNISVGGAGKTPLTIAIAKALRLRGVPVDVLSRGYGRQSILAERVLPDGTAVQFGDEPLLIAKEAQVPVYVAPFRYAAGQLAEAEIEAEIQASAQAAREAEAKASPGGAPHGPGFQPQPVPGQQGTHPAAPVAHGAAPAAPAPAIPGSVPPNWVAPGWDNKQPAPPQQFAAAPVAANPAAPALSAASPAAPPAPESQPQAGGPATPAPAPEATSAPEPPPLPPFRTPVHLLDDGFQHRQLNRNIDIVLLNQMDWKDWLLPAGNLREPREAVKRATIVAIPANEPEFEVALSVWGFTGPIWRIHRKVEIPFLVSPVAAFCGIARPEQFFAGIEASGLKIGYRISFADHYSYTVEVIQQLIEDAKANEVTAVLTTGKDLARMGKLAELFPKSMPLVLAKLTLQIEHEDSAMGDLIHRLRAAPAP